MKVEQQYISKAYYNFISLYFPDALKKDPGMGHYLWAFIGLKHVPTYYGPPWIMPEDAAHRLKLLAGPHYQTIAKMLEMNDHQYKWPL